MTEKKETEGQAQTQFPVKRTVVKGDHLIGLIEEVYGSRDARLVALVKQHNPEIKDSNKIRVGETLIFPAEGTLDR